MDSAVVVGEISVQTGDLPVADRGGRAVRLGQPRDPEFQHFVVLVLDERVHPVGIPFPRAEPAGREEGGDEFPERDRVPPRGVFQVARPGQPPNFAEAAAAATAAATAALTRRLGGASIHLVDGWVDYLQELVNNPAYDKPEALQEALLGAYGDLPTEQLAELMQLAFTLAQLRGMDAASQESTGD